MSDIVLVEVDGSVATVTLNRPDARNALNRDLRKAIPTTLLELDAREDISAIVLTGADLGPRPVGGALKREPTLFETNVPGIFAAGDVRAGSSKRVAAAVGEGAATVRFVHHYLATV